MVGIISYGAYIPFLRLSLAAISDSGRRGEGPAPEKAVANYDEDAVPDVKRKFLRDNARRVFKLD